MKRDPNIVPLSRDHHHALLFAWKIRQGLAIGAGLERIRLYVLYFWEHHLEQHFAAEEELLFRITDSPLCRQAMEEHRQIRELVDSIRRTGDGDRQNYTTLSDLLDRHIRLEERQLFPYLEQHLSPERLSQVGAELRRLHQDPLADDYSDAFWN